MEQVTIKEIAKLCGVGVSTVSRAINNHPDINQETKKQILETIRKYNYVPNNSARNLKRAASHTIAVLVKGISNPFFGDIIQMLEEEVASRKYSFVLQQVEDTEDEIEVAIQLEKEKRLKGIIFLGGMYSHSEESMSRLTVPFVISTVDMQLPESLGKCAVVSIDNEAESYRVVDELCKCGHERIAILTASREDESIAMSRLQGYRRALKDHRIDFDQNLVMYMKNEYNCRPYSAQNGYQMTKELLESGVEFSCIYAISDTMATGACRALFEAGRKVPEDVSVAGFDGLDIARYYCPSLMTVSQPREEMARETVHLLFDLIKGKNARKRVILDADLIRGESVRAI